MAATRDDWKKTKPMPAACDAISLDRTYTPSEFAILKEGHIPTRMEDKWFAYYEEPFLYLHRSWSGVCIYQVRFEPVCQGSRVVEVLVNRDAEQYPGTDGCRDGGLAGVLMDGYAGRDTSKGWGRLKAEWERRRTRRST